jgi:hypothetical protein
MADDPKEPDVPDAKRININRAHEVRYWCETFGVTPWTLKAAVKRVGTMPDVVAKELQAFKSTGQGADS